MRTKVAYTYVLEQLQLMEILKDFSPYLVGTPPLGIDVHSSDIDVICCYDPKQLHRLKQQLNLFKHHEAWQCQISKRNSSVWICRFKAFDWDLEVYCSTQPVHEQSAFKHFHVEQRLLAMGGEQFREAILDLKRQGVKTEPAFAQCLGLSGDAYELLEQLYEVEDEMLFILDINQ